MATVASSHKLFYRENNLLIAEGIRQKQDKLMTLYPFALYYESVSSICNVSGKRQHVSHDAFKRSPQNGKFCFVIKALSSTQKHLKSLDSYLGKLHVDHEQRSLKLLNQTAKSIGKSGQLKADDGLKSLENYLDKAKSDAESENYVNKDLQASIDTSAKKDQGSGRERSLKNYMELKTEDAVDNQISEDEASDFYLIGALASINIAVFLFDIATPVKNSNFELFSLPMIYGAKINSLILTGEWWRLVTPMFLHSGIFHIALGSWVLFTFGLEVSRGYGSFTLLLMYVLGGISGNLISFLHTPEPTVGGTGPVFAIIGAWLIYQVQNKDVIEKDASERMFQNAVIAIVLSFILSYFGPIDDWAHFGAAFTGIAYGFVTCPSVQVKDASSEAGRQERITLIRRYADPCKSLMYFSLSLLLLSSLLFIMEPPLDLIQ